MLDLYTLKTLRAEARRFKRQAERRVARDGDAYDIQDADTWARAANWLNAKIKDIEE